MTRGQKADQQAWGPTVAGGRRRPLRRLLRLLLLVVLLALLAFGGLAWWLSAQIPREDVDGLAVTSRPLHVLVVGTDSRAELSRQQQRELGVGGVDGQRADTIFLMTIQGGDVGLLAFPRDLWVPRCDGTMGRINVAIEASPTCMVETVSELSGIDIHHFVRVTFGGFVDVVDAVGGVELCLDQAISDRDAHIDLPAGCQVLDGTDALGYVRVRKIDDDLQRIGRQQQFVQALAREIATPATMLNPLRLYRLGDEAGGAVSVDDQLGVVSLARLAMGARGLARGDAVTHTVPGTPQMRGQAAVLLPDEQEAEALYARFRDGSVLDEAAAGVQPEQIEVAVLNGAGVGGLAGQIGQLLEDRGFQVTEVGNTDTRQDTVVAHPPDERAAAQLLARNLPGEVTLEERPDASQLVVLLGPGAGGR